MFKKIPKKLLLGLAGVIILLVAAYLFLVGSAEPSASLQVATSTTSTDETMGPDSAAMNEAVLEQLNSLQGINIDTDLFTSAAFTVLEDYSVVINPQEIGRENPFSPSTYVPSGNTMVPSSEVDLQLRLPDIESEETSTSSTTTENSESDQGTDTEADEESEAATSQEAATSSEDQE